ncbi:MAG: rcc01693 family protein [Roseobacter sp.]
MNSVDWPVLMRAGIQGLGLEPDAFWALTPAELQLLLGDPAKSGPLLSNGLETLMAAFPDKS